MAENIANKLEPLLGKMFQKQGYERSVDDFTRQDNLATGVFSNFKSRCGYSTLNRVMLQVTTSFELGESYKTAEGFEAEALNLVYHDLAAVLFSEARAKLIEAKLEIVGGNRRAALDRLEELEGFFEVPNA